MTGVEKDGVAPSLKEVAESEKVSREKLIEEGGPRQRSPEGASSPETNQPGIVSEVQEAG